MRILIIKNTAKIVDIEKRNSYNHQEIGLAKALNRAGHHCDVVFWGGKQKHTVKIPFDERGETFSLIYLRGKVFLKNVFYIGINRLVEQYDIIHSNGFDNFQSWRLAKWCPQKLVIYHGTYYSPFNVRYNLKTPIIDMMFLSTYKHNNITFCTKSHLAEEFLRKKGLKKITSIGVGIDLSIIENKAVLSNDFIEELHKQRADGYKLLLYIGRIEPRRNIKFLIDIISNLYQKDKIKLVIVGNGESDYVNECFNDINKKHVRDAIIYCDFLDQIYLKAVYQACDIFLLPTYYEIYGMVLLEAMYFGMPVITTHNGGADMMIRNDENGFVLENDNLEKWLEKINELIGDERKLKIVGEKAHITIRDFFTWDTLSKKLLEAYQMTLNRK